MNEQEIMDNILFDYISKYITLTADEKKAILDIETFKIVKKGSILLKEGQYSNEGYFVLKGCLRKYYLIDGEEKTTSFYTELEGEVPECVINKKPSSYYIFSGAKGVKVKSITSYVIEI